MKKNSLNGSRVSSRNSPSSWTSSTSKLRQEAQANPCSNNLDNDESSNDNRIGNLGDQECDLTGYFEFDERNIDSGLEADRD